MAQTLHLDRSRQTNFPSGVPDWFWASDADRQSHVVSQNIKPPNGLRAGQLKSRSFKATVQIHAKQQNARFYAH